MHASSRPEGRPPEHSQDVSKQVIVLGGGIAGIAAAEKLARRGENVLMLEGADRLGGVHKSVDIGPYSFDVGSIFYEHDAPLLDLAPDLRALCPKIRRLQRRIVPDGSIQHYPLDPSDVLRWPKGKLLRALGSMMVARLSKPRGDTLEDACLNRLGRRFFEGTGLRNYTIHFNGVTPDKIGREFYYSRMQFVHRSTGFWRVMRSGLRALFWRPLAKTKRPPLFVRPPGGYDVLFDRIEAQLIESGVTIEKKRPLQRITGSAGAMHVTAGGKTFSAAAVVGAMPLDSLHRGLFDAPSGLESLGLLSLFVSAEWLSPETGNVFYNFHPDGGWKRATIYSRIYPDSGAGRDYFTVEITVPPGTRRDPAQAFAAFAEHAAVLGFARGLTLEGSHLTPAAYPVFRHDQMTQAPDILDRVVKAGVVPVGRQGRFEYLPTSTGVIRRVAEVLNEDGFGAS